MLFYLIRYRILDIGIGAATAHLTIARKGGIMHGIDIRINNKIFTKIRSKIFKNPLKPRSLFNWMGKKLGWYIAIKAVK